MEYSDSSSIFQKILFASMKLREAYIETESERLERETREAIAKIMINP